MQRLRCFCSTRVFCVDNTNVENFTGTTAMMSVSTESDSTHTSQFSSSTSMDLSTTQIQPNSSLSELSGEPQGLTSGQVVGVAVGSITGVAALGGGIYAGLKYTGKLGG
ncbi:hypothetical protein DPX16_21255 [Anabarilius grahami]|uniref:Uncharacterized protein n=1 Tax=Anabarilius grahami TaxID=495550 RepID=A0A3N0XQG7_ANAGA|nr:hypothetical protein DPX16_21255 [Anabarilius grahami]